MRMPTATAEAALVARQKGALQIATVNVGPTTASFIPPESCNTLGFSSAPGMTSTMYMFSYGVKCDQYGVIRHLDTDCLPRLYGGALNNMLMAPQGAFGGGVQPLIYPVISPATACPGGYTPACSFTGVAPSNTSTTVDPASFNNFANRVTSLLPEGQTAVACCLSGYECDPSFPWYCKSTLAVGDVVTVDDNTSCDKNSLTPTPFTVPPGATPTANAPGVVLVHDATTSPTTSNQSQTSSSTSSATKSETAGAVPPQPRSGGLSTGSKAAIGVCIPVFFICAAVGIFFIWRRRIRAKASDASPAEDSSSTKDDKPEMYGGEMVWQLPDNSVAPERVLGRGIPAELETAKEPSARLHHDIMELPADDARELPGTDVVEATKN